MLVFDRPVPHVDGAFFDDADPNRIHVLPETMSPLASHGIQELSLLLHSSPTGQGGGVFQGRFAPSVDAPGPTAGMDWTMASISDCEICVTPRTEMPGAESLMTWAPAIMGGHGDIIVQLVLEARPAELMRQLALGGDETLELTFDLQIPGQASGIPAEAVVSGSRLHDHLAMALGPGLARRVEIENAFLSATNDMIEFESIGNASLPDRSTLLREAAARSMVLVFNPREGGFELRERHDLANLRISLDAPYTEVRAHRVRWSFGAFVAALDEAERDLHFALARTIEPFADADIRVLNHIPLDPRHAMKAVVDLIVPGASGTPESHRLEFRPNDPIVATQHARFPALVREFEVSSRIRLVISPGPDGGFPHIWPSDAEFEPVEDPLVVHVSPARLYVALVHVLAAEDVFELCSALRATFRHRGGETVSTLTADSPDARVVLTGHPDGTGYELGIEASPPEGTTAPDHLIREGSEDRTSVVVSRADLEVRQPDSIVCRIADESIGFAVLDVSTPSTGYVSSRVLRPGQSVEVAVWRPTVFSQLAYDWRAAVVRRDGEGRTRPMAQGDWVRATEPEIALT